MFPTVVFSSLSDSYSLFLFHVYSWYLWGFVIIFLLLNVNGMEYRWNMSVRHGYFKENKMHMLCQRTVFITYITSIPHFLQVPCLAYMDHYILLTWPVKMFVVEITTKHQCSMNNDGNFSIFLCRLAYIFLDSFHSFHCEWFQSTHIYLDIDLRI